jgi:hypothetical protein
MAMLFSDPFDALLQFQRALDTFRTGGWLGSSLSGSGGYPPLNIFRKGDDLVIVTEVSRRQKIRSGSSGEREHDPDRWDQSDTIRRGCEPASS